MVPLIFLAIVGFFVLACWRAYHSVQLRERDPDAWEKDQAFADHRRRQRQMALGKATETGVRMVRGWVSKGEEPKE
jgi:hypothetical protein